MSAESVIGSGELYWDPYDFDLHANPHPVWRRMREEAPLYRNDKYDFWALTRFDDVLNVLVDWKTYSRDEGGLLEKIRTPKNERIRFANLFDEGDPEDLRSMLELDPPRHDMYRHLLSRTFTPRAVKQIEERVRTFAEKLLDERIGSGGFDFVDEFGARIPALVIAAMLGTPDSDVEEIRHLTDAALAQASPTENEAAGETVVRHVGMASANREVADRIGEYYMGRIEARRRNPGDDIVSALVTMEFTDLHGVTRKLNDMEALGQVGLLSSAGNETTARHIGWVGSTLALYPDQRAKLVAHPELIPNGVEEILRFEGPSMCLARVPTRDVVWYDQVVPAGARARWSSTPPPGGISASFRILIRIPWMSSGASTGSCPSGSAPTCAWGRRWPEWRAVSPWRKC